MITPVKTKGLILLSGGIDSAVVLWWAKKKGWRLATLTFVFPGRRKMELRATRKLARSSGCRENFEIPLPFVPRPQARQACYIPRRNLMYYGIAASLAEKIGARYILGGHFRHDGRVFPDARKGYFKLLDRLIRIPIRDGHPIRLCLPFLDQSKTEIIKSGERLGVPFSQTWSCSRDSAKHCWNCSSCRERQKGFRSASIIDPLMS